MAELRNLAVIVNGRPTVVQANENAPLQSLIEKALKQTDNQGQPPENWEFKDPGGNPIPLHTKVSDLPADITLYLDLKRGVGG